MLETDRYGFWLISIFSENINYGEMAVEMGSSQHKEASQDQPRLEGVKLTGGNSAAKIGFQQPLVPGLARQFCSLTASWI